MTLLNPAGLLFGIFLLGLVLLYLWERNQRRVDIPSMLLWEVVPESVVRRNRFQPDSLFWLQLAGLACLVLGLANPYFEGADRDQRPGRAILIVDLSASMQTVEENGTRLELAREAAARIILSSKPETELMLIGAAREPKIVSAFTRNHDEVLDVAGTLEAGDVSANLEPVLAMAQRMAFQSPTATEIHVFTDLPREAVGARWRENVNWWPYGSSDDNVAIANVETTQGVLQNHRHASARVTVRNFGAREKHVALTVAVEGAPVAKELYTAAPYGVSTFHFPDIAASGILEASIETDDALAVDNSWRAWLPRFKPIRLALIGASTEFQNAVSRIGTATRAIEVASLGETNDNPGPDDADVAIYYRVTPDQLPRIPALLVAPSVDLSSRQDLKEVENLEVLDWSEQHDALRGIQPRLLRPFATVKVLDPPPWSETILAGRAPARDIPILVVGQPTNQRLAILAPDLAGDRLLASDRETALLLFLNLIDWLAGQQRQVPVVRTGESRPLDSSAGEIAEVIDPSGKRVDLPEGPKPFLSFDRVGVYQLRRENETSSTVLANFQDAAESRIDRKPEPVFRVETERLRNQGLRAGAGLQTWLYAVAAALLLAEWFAAGRSRDHG